MNTKKIFGAALSTIFVLSLLVGAGLTTNAKKPGDNSVRVQTRGVNLRDDSSEYSAADFHATDIKRDELIVDVTSLTSTTKSKSATITFKSTRLVGWGTNNQNAYVVIDDEDYSGSTDNPSLSGRTNPKFNGYTIELTNRATFTDSGVRKLVVPEEMIYSGSFSIENNTILKDSFVYTAKTAAISYIIIPAGVSKIEEKAFQNIPENIIIQCEADSKPVGWDDNWLYNSPNVTVEWGHELSRNEENYRNQNTGVNTKNYGYLTNAATSQSGAVLSIVDDVNFTGDYDNPVRNDYGLQKPYELNAYVNTIDLEMAGETLVIPNVLTYGSDLKLLNTSIVSRAISFEKETEDNPYTGSLKYIKIPKGITTIEANAIRNVPESVEIYVEYDKNELPLRWVSGWTDAKESQIHYGETMTEAEKIAAVENTDTKIRLANAATPYIIGYRYKEHKNQYYCPFDGNYYEAEDLVDGKINGHDVLELEDVTPIMEKPLVVYYEIKDTRTNQITPIWYEMKLVSEEDASTKNSYFDAVRDSNESRSFDIILEDNQEFIEDSVQIYNIFRQKTVYLMADTLVIEEGQEPRVEKKLKSFLVPDTSVNFTASASKRYSREININEIINYNYNGMSTFGDYTMVKMNVDKVFDANHRTYWHNAIGADIYRSHQDNLESGAYAIRFCIYGLSTSYYRVSYLPKGSNIEKTITIPIVTPKSTLELTKDSGNSVSFLIKSSDIADDFRPENMTEFEVIGLTLNIHVWDKEKSLKIGLTDVSVHFGAIDVMPHGSNTKDIFNVVLFIVIFLIVFTLLFAGGAVALYFYLKEKYKNNEFRRMKPKNISNHPSFPT